jgi:hypothetical protein
MRRKKAAVAVEPVVEGVIDLDEERPTMVPPTATDIEARQGVGPTSQWEAGVKELNEDNPTKPKRKYTKRVKKTGAVVPTFIDRTAIRNARVQVFIDYIDGKIEFASASYKDDKFRKLDAIAAELESENKA